MHSPLSVLAYYAVTIFVWTQYTASSDSLIEIFAQAGSCPADAKEPWSYRGSNGPTFWGDTYPQCLGPMQSPIRIDSSKALMNEDLEKILFIFYDFPIANLTIENDGTTIVVIPDFPLGRFIFVDSTFYGLYEIHFHWGRSRSRGSEHIVDDVQYTMEMHLLHKSAQNETAVVAVFFDQYSGINAELQHIVNELPKVMYKDTSVVSRFRLNLINLMPENPASFYLYGGSLTTPDCAENVKWILLKTPVLVGNSQIREFRKLSSATQDEAGAGCTISGNIRPIQHPHGRKVYSSKDDTISTPEVAE